MRRSLTLLLAFFLVVACGSSASPIVARPTAARVSVQSGDLPSGMHKCDLSGDIQSFLTKIKAKDASQYNTTKMEWDSAQKAGATAAEFVFFTDTTEHCSSVAANTQQLGSASYKLVFNVVIQFKDEATATNGFNNETIFSFSKTSLKASQVPIVEGKDTGLGPNSELLTISLGNQSFYIAIWQKKEFMIILVLLNVDSAAGKKAALAVDGRTQ